MRAAGDSLSRGEETGGEVVGVEGVVGVLVGPDDICCCLQVLSAPLSGPAGPADWERRHTSVGRVPSL